MVIKGYIKLVLALSFMLLAGTLFMGTEGAYAMSNDTQPKKAVKIVQTAGRQRIQSTGVSHFYLFHLQLPR